MKTIITYGTFDLFHIGHVRILKRLKSYGDFLIVGVSSDEFNFMKNKNSIMCYEERAEIVAAIKYVDLVIPEISWEQKIEDIKRYNVKMFGMGDDWKGRFDYLKEYCEVFYLSRTENISSTYLKETIKN